MQPKTYELAGLAIAGTCLGFLLPYWVPDVASSVATQAATAVGLAREFRLDQYVGVGFWLGTLLVFRGFLARWRAATGRGRR